MSEPESNPYKGFIAGGFGGICMVVSGHPLDTLKVRIQTMPVPAAGEPPKYTGTFDCVKQIFAKEGIRGFYRGMTAPIILEVPMSAFCFFGFNVGKSIQQNKPDDPLSYGQIFAAGMLGGVAQTSLTTPGDRIKCLLQVQQSSATTKYTGPIECGKHVYRQGGIRSIYRGTMITLLRDVPGIGVCFVVYEFVQRALTPQGGSRTDLSPLRILFAGGMAGVGTWIVGLPQDVLKSRLQSAPEGMYPMGARSVFSEMMRTEGISALCKGFGPIMLRAFLANADLGH